MDKGWIKLHRCILEKAIWKCSTPEQKAILITLLMMANHDEKQWVWEGQKFECKPGQMVTSTKHISTLSKTSRQNVRSALVKFEKLEFLTIKPTKTGSLITIVNWDFYQGNDGEGNQATNQEVTKSQPRGNQEVTTNKNVRIKECKKDIIGDFSSSEILQQRINDFIEMRKSIKKPMTDRAIELILIKLKKLAAEEESQIAILEQSIQNSWPGLFELKQDNPKGKSKLSPGKRKQYDEFNEFLTKDMTEEEKVDWNYGW